jgi:hypothetical protein
MTIPPAHFCKKELLYKACLSFGRFLTTEELMSDAEVDAIKALAPKRLTVKETDLIFVNTDVIALNRGRNAS